MTTVTPARHAEPVATRDAGGTLTGTIALVRFALWRDRVRLPLWIAGIAGFTVMVAASFPGLYRDAAAREARAVLMGSPGAVAMGGPQIGVADYTFGAMMTNEMLGFLVIFVGLMSILAVVRHSRGDEESGRTELVLATPVGRRAPLAAALLVALLANLVLTVLLAVGLAGIGIESMDWPGSVLYAVATGSVGVVFAAVAAVTAQLTAHARAASSLAGLVLGIAYALRAAGDVADNGLSWLSPIGWAQRTYAYVDNLWWPMLLSLGLTVALVAVAALLSTRRDFGAGLRQPRPGPASATPWLGTPLGLALRLHRVSVISWALAFLGFGLLYGTLFGQVEEFIATEVQAVASVLGGIGGDDVIESFLALLTILLAMTASVFAVLTALRPRSDENSGLGEALLATSVSRPAWVSSHAVVAAAGSALIVLAGTIGIGVSGGAALGDPGLVLDVIPAALVQLVPVLLIISITVALFGLVPRAVHAVWLVVGYGLFVATIGGLLGLPTWLLDLSPFTMVPQLPADEFALTPVLAMLAVSAALFAAGLWGIRRRDLQTPA